MAGINEIQERISKSNPAATAVEITTGIKATFNAIQDICAGGEKVIIKGFGTFQTKTRKARTGRNPQTGAALQIAAKKILTFKATK